MNMKTDLVNRALQAAGRKTLQRIEDENEREDTLGMCKAYYLSTYLEALSEVPWTRARRRKRLLKVSRPYGTRRFAYTLPVDCARPISVSSGGGRGGGVPRHLVDLMAPDDRRRYEILFGAGDDCEYVIEGNFLCTDVDGAELLYVTNGRVLPGIGAARAPAPGGKPDLLLTPGGPDESCIPPDETYDPGSPDDIRPGFMKDPRPDDDYPEYRTMDLDMEPKFYEYVEMMLAARLAMAKNNHKARHMLLQEALLVKNDAIASTRSIVKRKMGGEPWWGDTLGLRT